MPRDLESERATLDGMPPLTKEPENGAPPAQTFASPDSDSQLQLYRDEGGINELHPYCQALTSSDLESCIHLENATFPPHEACSREKFIYRLKACGELCLGLFTSATSTSTSPTLSTLSKEPFSHPADSSYPDRKSVLLAHCIATKSANLTVTDDDMAMPPLGHNEHGRTICLHSVAVLPEYQNLGLGRTIVLAFVQRMQSAGMADRVALLAHEKLVPFYERIGFENRGESKATYGGGGWFDMVLEFGPTTG
ncbi:acyl-CoA N-acyltransferase [Mytilinidion resinicola]|uniref:Acyl-CoA N-acyltransferase n=1 Tax=Mytilinidion resinicola TaxID=574789 RepID=A0A6A6YAT8_9PEZI|nr:acyl-CoA N-acyltransferase [Mytilinidion resinicola]KAF2805820.1 acyl-CoA N-acyltransferase [Mytilinidion resinicola]